MHRFWCALAVGTALSPALAMAQQGQPSSATAQSAADADAASDQGLQDIIVTAQKRAENLQDVPIAV